MLITDRVRVLRRCWKILGTTQAKIAKRARLPISTVGQAVRGKVDPRLSTADLILWATEKEYKKVGKKLDPTDRQAVQLIVYGMVTEQIPMDQYGVSVAKPYLNVAQRAGLI